LWYLVFGSDVAIGHASGAQLSLSVSSADNTVTTPLLPLTRRRSPVLIVSELVIVLTTQGMPSSRATTAAWLRCPPMSTTRALDRNMIEAQLGSVVAATRISPG